MALRADAVTDTPTERETEDVWTRLRPRNVVQWGIAYVAGGWAILQMNLPT